MASRRDFLKATGTASALSISGLAGCIGSFGSQPYADGDVRFLMSPTEPQDKMSAQYEPVQNRLTETIDAVDEVSIKYAANYAATLNALNSGTADVAETGPFSAALGVKSDKAEIILQRSAFGGWNYKSVIVTTEDSDIESASDLEGKTVAFADALSASGSLYPLYMLKKAGLGIPDEPGSPKGADFDPNWSSHASAKEALVNGQADAAGVGYFIVSGDESEYADGIQEVTAEEASRAHLSWSAPNSATRRRTRSRERSPKRRTRCTTAQTARKAPTTTSGSTAFANAAWTRTSPSSTSPTNSATAKTSSTTRKNNGLAAKRNIFAFQTKPSTIKKEWRQ